MPRFVILEHDWPTRHWDLLLEAGDVLRAWRLSADPEPGRDVPAEPNADHRLAYLDYEGPVSGGRGTVVRWAAGTFEWVEDEPGAAAIDFMAHGMAGRLVLEQRGEGWVCRLTPDRGRTPGESV